MLVHHVKGQPPASTYVREKVGVTCDTNRETPCRSRPRYPPMSARKLSQMIFLIPMYILQLSYGMHSGFPAILTPQLRDKNCDRFIIDDNEESWIGMYIQR